MYNRVLVYMEFSETQKSGSGKLTAFASEIETSGTYALVRLSDYTPAELRFVNTAAFTEDLLVLSRAVSARFLG